MEAHTLAMSKAKIALMSDAASVFFSTVVMSLKQSWSTEVAQAQVNGIEMTINPDYFMGLTPKQRVAMLVHEAMHVAYDHPGRVGDKDKKKYTEACNQAINNMLKDANFELPPTWEADSQYRNKSAEEIYRLLPDEEPDPDQQDLGDNASAGLTPEEMKEKIQEILVRASTAVQQSSNPGNMPGDLKVMLEKMLNPILPWYKILARFLNSFAKTDYSFRKPSRRHFPEYYLPSAFSEALSNFAVFPDLSGSTSDHEVSVMISEVSSIFKILKPNEVTMVPFDTSILDVIKVKSLHAMQNLDFHGRGGTNITPVIQWIEDNKPEFGLIFSDGEFSPPRVSTKVPVIWLIYNNPGFTAPFGKVIHFNI